MINDKKRKNIISFTLRLICSENQDEITTMIKSDIKIKI